MARRKTIMVILVLGLLVLLVAPWASAPAPEKAPAALPAGGPEATPAEPAA
ncbi:hypothetical protein H7C19_33455, partial [Cohnella nanjingensis]|nr:hypothetical protein [Cohnella nanjingensis]